MSGEQEKSWTWTIYQEFLNQIENFDIVKMLLLAKFQFLHASFSQFNHDKIFLWVGNGCYNITTDAFEITWINGPFQKINTITFEKN